MNIIKQVEDIIKNNNTVIFHIFNNGERIYLACFENNQILVTRNTKKYISQPFKFYTFLKKLNAIKIKEVDDYEYIIYCDFYTSKALIIQKYWKQYKIYRKKKLWNRIGLKLLTIISPHLGNPKLSGVRQRLLLNF